MRYFAGKKTIVLLRRAKSEAIFKKERKSSIFKKIVYTETNETNIRHFHSLIFVFAADGAFLLNFFDCITKPEMQIPLSFSCIVNKKRAA